MKELILDLRGIVLGGDREDEDEGGEWADCLARAEIENALLDYVGKVIRVRITVFSKDSETTSTSSV